MGRKLRAITRTIRRRSGEAKEEVLALTEQTGELLTKLGEGGAAARDDRSQQGARTRREGEAEGGRRSEEMADRCEKVAASDTPAGGGHADQGPDRVVVRSGRQADPQGEAGETERIWIREPVWRR